MIKLTVQELLQLNKEEIKGKVIVFPTDTVYGIGAIYDDEVGIQKIYNLKHRDKSKPLACLASSVDEVLDYVIINNKDTYKYMNYWPGALTLIFEKNKYTVVDKDINTIAFRIPNSLVALKILKHLGIMAVTSMNLSGSEPLNDLVSIETAFGTEIDYLIIDEEKTSKVSSTILDVSKDKVFVIRKGELFEKINV